ncbi:MAG: protein translocase subunit SecD [Patescibacteria group bacterium]
MTSNNTIYKQQNEEESNSPLVFLKWISWPIVKLGRLMFGNMSQRKQMWYLLIGILALSMFAGLIDWPKVPNWVPGVSFWNKFNVQLGLDLQGGSHLVYQADITGIPPGDEAAAVEGVRDVVERRVNFFGVSEPVVQTNRAGDNWRVIIELPGVKDVNQAIKLIGETPILEFKEQSTAPVQPTETDTEVRKRAANILIQALKPKADFDALAKDFSEDEGSKTQGGDVGWFKEGVMVPEFEQAVKSMTVNEINKALIQTQFGFHIIKKTGQRQVKENDQEIAEYRASHILIKTPQTQPADNWQSTGLSGKQLKRAQVQFDNNTGLPEVQLVFNDEGKDLFSEITSRNVGKPVAIFLDGLPISVPTVQQAITGGEAVITGNFSLTEAKQLVQRLNAGALPVPIHLINQQSIDATLGKVSLEKSLMAGIIGLALVALFMLLYYRLPGLLSVIALGIYALVTFAIFKLWPITLTLAGIAGFVLSVGMAVDANILIFERMKEELRLGKSLGQAIEEGFKRAWTSIRDSNISSLITSVILIWFGSSLIKGFAITLCIGILISMFSAITVTRTFLRLISVGALSRATFLFGVRKGAKNEEAKTQ